ncbi:MAG: B-box zinc finger protein [Acidobacteriota bacterium]|nr:B-box zinc finger protein [Acidobacteriota bacterium]
MNCYLHPETPAVAFCRTCGRSLCGLCQRPAEGTVFCQDHVPVSAYSQAGASYPPSGAGYSQGGAAEPNPAANPYFQQGAAAPPSGVRTSPGLAFILGFIPGVGAIYNGQYLKGLVHALVFGLLVTIMNSTPEGSQPLIGIVLAAFIFYMPFEAYHTAKKREMGLMPDEWSSILPRNQYAGKAPVGPIVLIAVGVLYLLNTLNLVDFHQIGRFWPVILILVGAYMLYSRVTATREAPPSAAQPFADARPNSNDFAGKQHE